MKSVRIFLLAISVFIFAFSSLVYAEVPQMINYQGKITKPSGALIDTTVAMVFSIYSDSTGGIPLWTETQTVKVEYGVYSVLLGSVTPIPSSVFNGSVRYLGLKVGSDAEMSPRKPLVSVGYAFKALIGDDDWDGAGTGKMFTHFLTDKVGIGTTTPRSQLDVRCPSDTSSYIRLEPDMHGGCNSVGILMREYRNHNELAINAYDEFWGNFIYTRDSSERYGQGFGIAGGNGFIPFERFVVNTDSMFLGYAIRPGDGGRIPSNDGGGNLFINGNVGIGTLSPQRALHISDVMRLEPRASAPSDPSEGDIYVNSTDHHMYCYLNGVWKQLDN